MWCSVRAVCLLLASAVSAGALATEKPPAATVGRGPGTLAFSTDKSDGWRVARPGDALPEVCLLRTTATDPVRVALAGAALVVAPDARVRLDSRRRIVTLESGRLFLDTGEETAWTATAAGMEVLLDADSAAELTAEAGKPVSVSATRGSLRVSFLKDKKEKSTAVDAGNKLDFNPEDGTWTVAPLEAGDRERIAQWTAPPKPAQGLGQLVIQDVQSGAPTRLNIARYSVHVVLQPPVALVQIDQSFYNPYDRQEEGTFVFNLPRGASVSRFAMYVTPSELIEGELIERNRAAGIYQSIVSRRRDPAILEQIGDDLFKMRVFPVFARDTKRILLDYTLPLEGDDGEYQFRLPLLSDLKPIWDFSLSGVIHGPTRRESVVCRSHPETRFSPVNDRTLEFSHASRNYQPQTDFTLSFTQATGEGPTLRSYVARPLPPRQDDRQEAVDDPWRTRPATYFMASIAPEPGKANPGRPAPADVLILADTSSGLRDQEAVRRQAAMIVHNLRHGDRFRLVCVDVACRELHDGWLQPDDADSALARLGEQFCLGGTNLDVAFKEALAGFDAEAPGRRRLVVYLGDGEDTLSHGERDLPGVLAGHSAGAKAMLCAVLVRKSDRGRRLMEALARETGGLVFDNVAGNRGERDLFGWLLAGLPEPAKIVNVEIEGADGDDLFYSTAWLPGERLRVLGRTTATDRLRLKLTVAQGGKPVTLRRELAIDRLQTDDAQEDEDVFIGRLWAQGKLDRLRREQSASADDSDEHRRRIIALSQEWSLLSPLTAFLVLETEADYARWNIDRQQRRRYWKPADAVARAPLPPKWLALVTPEAAEVESDPREFAEVIRRARRALADGDPSAALRLLSRVQEFPAAKVSPAYAELNRRARAGLQTAAPLERLGPHRGLLDPSRPGEWPWRNPRVTPLLVASTAVGADFSRRHPHAERLLKEVELLFFDLSLDEFTGFLADSTGTNVILDQGALEDVGIGGDVRVAPLGWGKLSLRNYTRFVLEQLDLVLVEEPHRLLITTPEEAEAKLATEVYPLTDLVLTDRVADFDALVDPYMDREEAARRRIRARLKKPTSVRFDKAPLNEVVRHFGESIGDTVLIDQRSLEDVGISTDTPITASFADVPAEEALRWILESLDLDFVVQQEALIILTPEEKEIRSEVRLHSGRGVVYDYRVPPGQATAFGRRGPWGGMAGFGGGMASGMGGMGFGGGMGGMGMGAMGAGGGMGGMAFGGGMGGMAGFGSGTSGSVGLSSGGEGAAPAEEPETPADEAMAEPPPLIGPVETDLSLVVSQTQEQFAADFDSAFDLITSTIAPETWDDVGGPGSLSFCEPTLDFVINTTDVVHDQIASLFDRLRRMPPVAGPEGAVRPAQVRPVGPDDALSIDWDGFVEMITSNVHPSDWEDVGGWGTISVDTPRMALIVSQTADVHDDLSRLLTMLRRSRYTALRPDRPWESAYAATGGPLVGSPAAVGISTDLRLAQLPEPKAEEISALEARRVLDDVRCRWRRVEPGGGAAETIAIRRWAVRPGADCLEIESPDCVIRTRGDAVAVAWPDLALVEHGDWAEAARRALDGRLPWMPHRTNRELAQWFDVRRVDGEKDRNRSKLVCLRLVPPGFDGRGDTYIEAAFSKKDGLPRTWESYVEGELTGRLRFSDLRDDKKLPAWGGVVLEDASGKPWVRWELTEAKLAGKNIPDLAAGFDDYVQLDLRSEEPIVDREFHRALGAMRKGDWPAAVRELDAADKVHPRQPLLKLLRAWCYRHDPELGTHARLVAALQEVAAGDAMALTRFIAEGNFPSLTAAERYEILALAPSKKRKAEDWDHLARAAANAGKLDEALRHGESALAAGARDGREFERRRLRVELMLRLDRADEAVAAVDDWAGGDPTPDQLATMAELLARYGVAEAPERLFDLALEPRDLPAAARFALMRRRADVQAGMPRWRTLLAAAALVPVDSPGRGECLATVAAELDRPIHAEVASQLAAQTEDAHLKGRLLLRQAELTLDRASAAEVSWQVHQAGRLPDARFCWACEVWNRAGQPQRVVRAAEQRLRSGKELSADGVWELREAYRTLGRDRDALRAATHDPKPTPSPPTTFGDPFGPGPGMGMF